MLYKKTFWNNLLTYIHTDCFLIFLYEILKFQIFFFKLYRVDLSWSELTHVIQDPVS